MSDASLSDARLIEAVAPAGVAFPPAAGSVRSLVSRQPRVVRDLALYGLCSAAALGIDWSVLILLVQEGVAPMLAAAASFSLGMIVAYLASITFVFADRRRGSPVREALIFSLIGIAGLGLSELLLWIFAAHLGLSAPVAKAPTAVAVFLFNFALRRALLFAGLSP